jgi:hypothetical protein
MRPARLAASEWSASPVPSAEPSFTKRSEVAGSPASSRNASASSRSASFKQGTTTVAVAAAVKASSRAPR